MDQSRVEPSNVATLGQVSPGRVAVPLERDENPVRVFSTFTEDLEAMARWLAS